MGKKSDQTLGEKKMSPFCRMGHRTVNLLGILLAFGVAFGGMFAVRNQLTEEKNVLLEGSGMIAIPMQSYVTEAQNSVESPEKTELTEEELVQVVKNLGRDAEVYAHEPLQGQITMVQALECGRSWLEEFFLPHLQTKAELSGEYKTSCHLWALREEDTGSELESSLLSYWTLTLENQDLSASLTLNAATGQVLDASVCCYFPMELWEQGSLISLLGDYTDSFGIEEIYTSLIVDKDQTIHERNGWGMYQSLADGELFAVIQTSSLVVTSTMDNELIYEDIFSVQLYLSTQFSMVYAD